MLSDSFYSLVVDFDMPYACPHRLLFTKSHIVEDLGLGVDFTFV